MMGVATGNLERIGRAKLSHAGLLHYFDFAGYSDAHEYRVDVFRTALTKARVLRSHNATVCVVGDTPEDIRSARANDLDVIAVATGIYSFEELQAARPTRCLHSLTELFIAN
jgi:phosphoglycolate phosphatase